MSPIFIWLISWISVKVELFRTGHSIGRVFEYQFVGRRFDVRRWLVRYPTPVGARPLRPPISIGMNPHLGAIWNVWRRWTLSVSPAYSFPFDGLCCSFNIKRNHLTKHKMWLSFIDEISDYLFHLTRIKNCEIVIETQTNPQPDGVVSPFIITRILHSAHRKANPPFFILF